MFPPEPIYVKYLLKVTEGNGLCGASTSAPDYSASLDNIVKCMSAEPMVSLTQNDIHILDSMSCDYYESR
jgi:hypothetical protein